MIKPYRLGLVLGAFLGLVHLCWAILVATRLAGPLINFIFRLHFIAPAYIITEFQLTTAIGLVAITTILGYVFGVVLGTLWNWVHHS